VEGHGSLKELTAGGVPPAVARRVLRLIDLAEYKRRQAPPGVKITPRAFGRDRRMPITNGFRPWE
jgi:NAD+ synthase